MKSSLSIIFITFFSFLYSSGIAQSNFLIKLSLPADSLPKECLSQLDINNVIQISKNYIVTGVKCKIDNIEYNLGLDKFSNIIFYSVYDTNFLINNFRFITKNKTVLDSIKKAEVIFEPGWAAYIKLPDDWNLAFENKDIVKNKSGLCLKINAAPKFLFKRRNDYNSGATVPKSWGKSTNIRSLKK